MTKNIIIALAIICVSIVMITCVGMLTNHTVKLQCNDTTISANTKSKKNVHQRKFALNVNAIVL